MKTWIYYNSRLKAFWIVKMRAAPAVMFLANGTWERQGT